MVKDSAGSLSLRRLSFLAQFLFSTHLSERRNTMVNIYRRWLTAAVLGLLGGSAMAQTPEKAPAPAPPPAAAPVQVPQGNAATVNGQAIPEKAIFRALRRLPDDKRAAARADVLNWLVDNILIDQELLKQNVTVEKKDIDKRVETIKAEIEKERKEFTAVLKDILLTEEELRAQIKADLRWDKYSTQLASDAKLKQLFDDNLAMFNGSLVHARHILLTPPAGDTKAAEQARAKLADIRKQILAKVDAEMSKIHETDKLKLEVERCKQLDKAFAEFASKESACPSKAQGGNLPWFPRAGKMVEPFAKAAFALKPFEMSDVVTTKFGYHLILLLEVKPGRAVKFEDVKDVAKDMFCDRLRDEMLAKLRPAAKIVVNPEPKP
jgi:parvulin-like peptidyl-prolyl isomerase